MLLHPTSLNILELKTQIDPKTVVVGDFNTALLPIDRSSKQKINKEGWWSGSSSRAPASQV
jgi:hypothetical protein